MISLFDAGVIAFILEMKSVRVDVTQGDLVATGELGSIKMEQIDSVGKVLRFDGDLYTLSYRLNSEIKKEAHYRSYFLILGKLDFGPFVAHNLFLPLEEISEVIQKQATSKAHRSDYIPAAQRDLDERLTKFEENLKLPYSGGRILREALQMRSLLVMQIHELIKEDAGIWARWQYTDEEARLREAVSGIFVSCD